MQYGVDFSKAPEADQEEVQEMLWHFERHFDGKKAAIRPVMEHGSFEAQRKIYVGILNKLGLLYGDTRRN